MSAAYEIAKLLYGKKVRLTEQHPFNALMEADEETKAAAVDLYFEHAKDVDQQTWDAISSARESEIRAAHKARDLMHIGRQIVNCLYAYVEEVAGDDIDRELWILQLEERDAA